MFSKTPPEDLPPENLGSQFPHPQVLTQSLSTSLILSGNSLVAVHPQVRVSWPLESTCTKPHSQVAMLGGQRGVLGPWQTSFSAVAPESVVCKN